MNPMKALVVDDSRAMRMLIGRILSNIGFEIEEAKDGQDALARLATDPLPDVVLIDWNMPVMDGLTFVKVVRADPRLRRITLMMVTTESERSQMVLALSVGAHEYLIKPFTEESLVDKLTLLGLYRPAPATA